MSELPDIQEWKETLSITDIVLAEGIRRRGKKFLCPFHGDKDPSMSVKEDDGFFHCFGCKAGGDAITFIRKLHRLNFMEALVYLGYPAGDMTPAQKLSLNQQIREYRRQARAVKKFRLWQSAYFNHLIDLKNLAEDLLAGPPMTPDELETLWPMFHNLPVIEYHTDILTYGSEDERIALCKDRIDMRCAVTEAVL
jgi:hypothetical protein